MSTKANLNAQGVTVIFEDVTVTAHGVSILDHVNASVPSGSWTTIVGPNGAGKTTMIQALLGLISHGGKVRFINGGKTPRIGYVPQSFAFDRGMPLTVMEFMLMGQQRLPFWFGCRSGKLKARELLTAVRAEKLEGHQIGALSGGELQRVLLALALQEEPDLLILDEPTAGIDCRGEQLFCELLDELRKQRRFTQLMVSHDLAMVTHHSTHVICLNSRVMTEGTPAQVLTKETLKMVFGLHMGLFQKEVRHD